MFNKTIINRIALILTVALASLTPASPVSAGTNVWTSLGPYGSDVLALAIDPITPGILYAGTAGNGVFKSANGGATWVSAGLSNQDVDALAIDTQTPANLYAGTSGQGVYKSTDGAASWSLINGLTIAHVQAIAIDPQTIMTVYAVVNNAAFKSINGGVSWSSLTIGPEPFANVVALVIDPQSPQTLYAGAHRVCTHGCIYAENGIFKSTDGGASWKAADNGLTDKDIQTLAIDPHTPAILYAGTGAGVSRSTDGGASWFPATTGLPLGSFLGAIAIDPHTPAVLYAGTFDGLFKSTNSGVSWNPANTGLTAHHITALAVNPAAPATVYAGTLAAVDGASLPTDGGVFKSSDGGVGWSPMNHGLAGGAIRVLAIDPITPSQLYVGTEHGNVFKSTDAGLTWSLANTGRPACTLVTTLAIDPQTPATLYAGTFSFCIPPDNQPAGIFKSVNGGASWSPINNGLPLPTGIVALSVDPQTPATLYAATFAGLFKSTNAGAAWNPANMGLSNHVVAALVINPATPATLYAGTNAGVFKSTNAGASWDPANNGLPLNADMATLAIDPQTPAILYAVTAFDGLFKSADGGASWNPANNGLNLHPINALAIDRITPSTLYAGTIDGLFKSADGGASWCPLNTTGLTNINIGALAIDPAVPATLYVGTQGGLATMQQVFAVTAVSPGIGVSSGGSPVTIQGWDFVPNTTLTIGGLPAANLTVLNTSTITGTAPAHAPGIVDVVVTKPDHQSITLHNGFVYADVVYPLYLPLVTR